MKNNLLLPLLSLLVLTTLFTSCIKEINKNVTVVRDCTGTYLRMDGKDYQVCNLEKVSPFADGVTVKASFKKLQECNGSARYAIICKMNHQDEGWIEVDKIKQ